MNEPRKLTNDERRELLRQAAAVRGRAYAPYSGYAVGAALLTTQGKIYTGVNIENAAYPDGICAERVAIFRAVTEEDLEFVAIAICTANGGTPCGSCRQVMAEFSRPMVVLIGDDNGNLLQETTVADLLPGAFGPAQLRR
jgi:cytidine deaminase